MINEHCLREFCVGIKGTGSLLSHKTKIGAKTTHNNATKFDNRGESPLLRFCR